MSKIYYKKKGKPDFGKLRCFLWFSCIEELFIQKQNLQEKIGCNDYAVKDHDALSISQ